MQAVIILQGTAVLLGTKGIYEHVCAASPPQLKDLLASFSGPRGQVARPYAWNSPSTWTSVTFDA